MPDRVFVTVLLALLSFDAAVCAAQTAPVPLQPDTKSAGYHSGFVDGCLHATSGDRRNDARYETDAAYHAGWHQGNINCHVQLDTLQSKGDPNGPLKNIF